MITFKPCIKPSGRRKDGTWPVHIRITFKGVVRRLPTTLVCTEGDLTRSGRIKNATLLHKADRLIEQMRATCDDLSPFTLEEWDTDRVVAHIREVLLADSFRLDFFAFADGFITGKGDQTRRNYITALNAFERFLGCREIDVNAITRAMLLDFVEKMEADPALHRNRRGEYRETSRRKVPGGESSLIIAKLAHIYNAAKWKYNDEDTGRILIPRSPFDGLRKSYPPGKGQDCLEVEVVQRLIDAEPEDELVRISRAAFLLSLCTMGANLADLYGARTPEGEVWTYNRKKTARRRADRAEAKVYLFPETSALVASLGGHYGDAGEWWLPALHRWCPTGVTAMVNRGLRRWCDSEGVEPFTFYAARHTFATLCRRLRVEKATIDEALIHIGEYRVTDIYAERNWSLAWDATRLVLDLFRWEK